MSTSEAPLWVAEPSPGQNAAARASAPTAEETPPAAEEPASLALTRGRRARQHADPEDGFYRSEH